MNNMNMNTNTTLPSWISTKHAEMQADTTQSSAIKQFREMHWQAFSQMGLPKVNDERWKYADLSFLQQAFVSAETNAHDIISHIVEEYRQKHPQALVFVMLNGHYQETLSDVAKLPKEMTICSWRDAFDNYVELISESMRQYPFATLNAALSADGLFIHVKDQFNLKEPLHILSLTSEVNVLNPAHGIILGKQSQLTLVEDFQSITSHQYLLNTVLHVSLLHGAKLTRYKLQTENHHACHIAHTFVTQAADTDLKHHSFSFGGNFARDELAIHLRGQGAKSHTAGLYALNHKNQYIDHHVDIYHHQARTQSEMLYKGMVKDKSRAVFNGRLYVDQAAQKITAYQANHNLLLSNHAEVYSKPELEIYADDVKCKHGATTGQLNQDALFYLRSRGISLKQATHILLKAFADEVLQGINLPDLKQKLEQNLAHLVTTYEK